MRSFCVLFKSGYTLFPNSHHLEINDVLLGNTDGFLNEDIWLGFRKSQCELTHCAIIDAKYSKILIVPYWSSNYCYYLNTFIFSNWLPHFIKKSFASYICHQLLCNSQVNSYYSPLWHKLNMFLKDVLFSQIVTDGDHI